MAVARKKAPVDIRAAERLPENAAVDTGWLTRALQPSKIHVVPAPSPQATFHWGVRPADGCIDPSWTVYTDGSLLDGPLVELRRAGWAFVALDEDGVVRASASGLPPSWICTIFGAETWAVRQAVSCGVGQAILRIDSKSVVTLLAAGRSRAVAPTRLTASAWAAIFASLDDQPPADLAWMPAHTTAADVGCRFFSKGELLSARDRRGNDLADALAKQAVEAQRVPRRIRNAIHEQEREVTEMAWWVARTTVEANAWGPQRFRDSVSAPRRSSPGAPGPRKALRPAVAVPPAQGGHDIVRASPGRIRQWVCRACRRSSAKRFPFAASSCPFSAAARWAQQAVIAARAGAPIGPGHVLLLSDSVTWCFRCGA